MEEHLLVSKLCDVVEFVEEHLLVSKLCVCGGDISPVYYYYPLVL